LTPYPIDNVVRRSGLIAAAARSARRRAWRMRVCSG
jgi:hypothetical protein